jgi:hypothetical protein
MATPSPAAMALGYGQAGSMFTGSSLADQLANETEEEKRRRLAAMAQSQRPGSVGQGYSSAISAAGNALGLT